MNEEQFEKIQEIIQDTWDRHNSVSESISMLEDLIYEIRSDARREVE
jgi:predicted metal-dependent hydrolase